LSGVLTLIVARQLDLICIDELGYVTPFRIFSEMASKTIWTPAVVAGHQQSGGNR
jgi:hypothetical protein